MRAKTTFTRLQRTRMNSRAITQRWPIGDDLRAEVVAELRTVLQDPKASNREKLAAAKGLLAGEAQNQKDDHKILNVQSDKGPPDLNAIAADLGISPALIGVKSAEGSQ